MAIRIPSSLHRNRYGILYFRMAVPADLQHHFSCKEIYRSLRTAKIQEAKDAAQTLSIALKRLFMQLRSGTMSSQKKTSTNSCGGLEVGLIRELSLDEFMRPKLTLIPEPGDTPEDRIQAQVEFLRATGFAGAGVGSPAPAKPLILFSELVEDYKRDRLGGNKWTPVTQKENLAIYKLFIDIVGDLPIRDIDDDVALGYVETLKKLPANMNKVPAYRGKTIDEIIALDPPPMTVRTFNKHLERISSLFKFATRKPKYDLRYNPFSGRSLDDSDSKKRESFSVDELALLFSATEHAQRKYKSAYTYWLPIMGLLTGARLNELCQLHLTDFEVVGGIHCINIQDEQENQRLKNKSARRHIPIHDKLLEVGLIRYVERLRAQGQERLFPELKFYEKGGYGKKPSEWFSAFRKRCGILGHQTKVFHSFRHTFISFLLNNNVPETEIAPIVGHEGKLITSQVYWNIKDPTKRKPTVERFQPPPEVWNLVPKFEEITIGRASVVSLKRGS